MNHTSKIVICSNWFVTNYAKQYFTVYEVPTQEEGKQGRRFFVWTNYKSTEDSYSKQLFDPYCRKERILIPYKEEQRIETTIAQMHFFKWAILNRVLDYIEEHYDEIEKDMLEAQIKAACGTAKGIEGVCSWNRIQKKTMAFSASILAEEDPELHQKYLVPRKPTPSLSVSLMRSYPFQ